MRAVILANLKAAIAPAVAEDLLKSYEKLVTEYRKGDSESALNASGKFVEHVLRAIEFLRTGVVPTEIKSVGAAIKEIEKDGRLAESVRLLVPRVASAMIFDVRSKRGAAHVKEIDPRDIDAALAVQAASWIMSEFIRLYHVAGEREVVEAISSLVRGNVPLIERFGDELVVTTKLPPEVEILLHVFAAEPNGIDRRGLGAAVKRPASTVTKVIQRLESELFIHKTRQGTFRITGPGEQALAERLAIAHGLATTIRAHTA